MKFAMEQKPGPSKESEPPIKKVKYDINKHKRLTEEDLFALLEESDEEDPFINESDDDPEFIPSSDSEEDIESTPSSPETPVPSTSQWSYHEMPKTDIPFTGVSGILVNVSGAEPIDYFNLWQQKSSIYIFAPKLTHMLWNYFPKVKESNQGLVVGRT
ncbi:hypothetical protein NQ314_019147 [Rhamnusium bicolor]|uniref:Uncharacterized protein n=1 Tax=Rhamnusium bicolor TaxID=1586634 RepID=A0AAV8WP80_9CUCU|nr:hypothetical protein NQ314_019147 [Rhamnusium bicolor]